jgi:2-oxoglutarate dehydrogenase E1 component
MIRTLPRSFRSAVRPLPRSTSRLYQSAASRPTPSTTSAHPTDATSSRTYATEATPPSPNDLFANGTNAFYADEYVFLSSKENIIKTNTDIGRMYRHWKSDPKSVHVSWATYFEGLDRGIPSASAYTPAPKAGSAGPSGGQGTTLQSAPDLHAPGGGEIVDYLKVCSRPGAWRILC